MFAMHDAMTPYAVFHDWVPVSIALAGFFWGLYTYHRSTRLQLFQHRFAIYQSVQQVFKQSYEKSGLTKEELHNFRHATEHRDFLFGPKVGAYINTIMGAAVTVNRDSEELAVNQSRLVQLLTGPAEQSARDAVEESRRKLQAACQRLRVLLEN